jgi:polyphosphate kinase 2 (PPK2 family)
MNEHLKEHIKLVKHAEALNGRRVAIVFEGRDSAGKSASIKYLTQYLNPKRFDICPSFMPSKTLMKSWLSGWAKKLPKENQIVLFDRSWYSRALVQPVNEWCTEKQYKSFAKNVRTWESEQDVIFIKFWLSIDKSKQAQNLIDRQNSELIFWKYSENDAKALENFGKMTVAKELMFDFSDAWIIIDFNDREIGKLKMIREINRRLK